MSLVSFESWELILQFVSSGLTKLDETIGYCWCPIVVRWSLWLQQRLLWLHHCDVIHWDNKAVSQWLLTFNLCVSVTWPLTCAFHIPCTHTPEIIDRHKEQYLRSRDTGALQYRPLSTSSLCMYVLYVFSNLLYRKQNVETYSTRYVIESYQVLYPQQQPKCDHDRSCIAISLLLELAPLNLFS